ncbi:MAG: inositol monophosphatase family protein [Pirellulales bacterium]
MCDYIKVCEEAARVGGAVLQAWLGRFTAREKGPADFVTEADLAAQDAIRQTLLGAFPDHEFLGEEGADLEKPRAEYRWIVDPLDGTTNYVHRYPHYCVSVALERAGKVIVGAVFDPVLEECFTAVTGQGAYLNGRRLRASGVTRLAEALAAASFPAKVTRKTPEIAEFLAVLLAAQTVRRTGSAALNLCYLAAGRVDVNWATSTKIWDVAAAALMVEEAGGVITAPDGRPFHCERPQFVAAATQPLHDELQQVLKQAR